MRSVLPLLLSLGAVVAALDAPSTHDLVVMLAPAPGDDARATRARAALAPTLEALGLAPRGTLADGLPASARADGRPRALDPARVLRVSAADSAAAARALDLLRASPAVAWAEPVRLREAVAVPALDDPFLADGRQWALENRGPLAPAGGVAGADIGARAAWALTTGSGDVLLALADTGIDAAHPEFGGVLPDGRARKTHKSPN